MKKILALLVAIVLLMSSTAFAVADIDKVVFELTSFGILKGDGNGNFRLEDTVTRAEFAQMVVRMLGYEQYATGMENPFKDVPDSSWMTGGITILSHLGFISGDPDGSFRPNDPVLVQECEKILLHVLGFENVAGAYGGYPQGYTKLATQIDLNDGVPFNHTAVATRETAARLVYNAIYSHPLETYIYGRDAFIQAGELFVKRLMTNGDIKHISGILTSTYDTWLSKPFANIEENQVEINGLLFNCGNINADKYLGYSVEVYYLEEIDGKRDILNIAPSNRNSEFTVSARNVSSVSLTEITYRDENSEKDAITVNGETVWLYNNRVMKDFAVENLKVAKGSYLCVNNDYDTDYEYVFIYEYESGVVDRVNLNGCIYLTRETLIDGRDYVLAKEDRDVIYRITDINGNRMLLSEIEQGDVVTVCKSIDGSYVGIEVSKEKVTGYYEKLRKTDYATISSVEYPLMEGTDLSEMKFGSYINAYLNSYGEIVYVEYAEEILDNYGYIMQTGSEAFSDVQVKMLVCNDVVLDTEASEDSDDTNLIPVLICQNKEVAVYDVRENIKINDKRADASEIGEHLGKIAKYALDENGKIKEIKILDVEFGSVVTKMQYNSKDRTFGGIAGITPFGINQDTKVICVPTDGDADKRDLLATVKIDNRDPEANVKYLASGYELDEDTQCVKLLVVKEKLDADPTINVTVSSDIGLVVDHQTSISENNEVVSEIKMLHKGQEKTYLSKDLSPQNGDTQDLCEGDFVIFETNRDGEIINSKIIKRLSTGVEHTQNNIGGVNGSITGIVTDVHRLQINNELNKRVHIVELKVGEFYYEVELPARNIPSIYIYNENKKDIATVGSLDDIVYGDVITVAMPGGNASDCVIIRGE